MSNEYPPDSYPVTEEYPPAPLPPRPPRTAPRYLDRPEDFIHLDKTLVMSIGGGILCFLMGLLVGAVIW